MLYLNKSGIANIAHLTVFLSGVFPRATVDQQGYLGVLSGGDVVEINAILASIAWAGKLEKLSTMGPLRPIYGGDLQYPHSVYSIGAVATDPTRL
jgi:hypothetical protein